MFRAKVKEVSEERDEALRAVKRVKSELKEKQSKLDEAQRKCGEAQEEVQAHMAAIESI